MSAAVDLSFHGLDLQVPSSWQEQTLYRYLVPSQDGTTGAGLHTNIIITRHQARPGQSLEQALTRPAQGTFESGLGLVAGRPAAWLDLDFDSEHAGVRLFQRQIAVVGSDGAFVIFTLTSVDTGLDAVTAQLGFVKAT